MPLPDAAEQPRENSKICVDVTAGGPADKPNPAIEKVARFVNIYAGGGKRPAKVQITVVLHGKATATALNDKALAAKFNVPRNPNRPLLTKLRNAGVNLLVCGQSLAHNGHGLADVVPEAEVAVSALTANVNHQAKGYARISLH